MAWGVRTYHVNRIVWGIQHAEYLLNLMFFPRLGIYVCMMYLVKRRRMALSTTTGYFPGCRWDIKSTSAQHCSSSRADNYNPMRGFLAAAVWASFRRKGKEGCCSRACCPNLGFRSPQDSLEAIKRCVEYSSHLKYFFVVGWPFQLIGGVLAVTVLGFVWA